MRMALSAQVDKSWQVLSMLAQSTEFENMQVREEELEELDRLSKDVCEYDIKGGPENKHGKAAILMQVCLLCWCYNIHLAALTPPRML